MPADEPAVGGVPLAALNERESEGVPERDSNLSGTFREQR